MVVFFNSTKITCNFCRIGSWRERLKWFFCARARCCVLRQSSLWVSVPQPSTLSTDYYKILASDLYLPSIKLTFQSDSIQFLLLWCEYSRLLSDCRPVTRWHHLFEPTVTSKRRRFCVSLNFESQRKAIMEFHRRNGTTAGLIFNISPSGKIFPLMSCRLLNFRKNSFSLKLFQVPKSKVFCPSFPTYAKIFSSKLRRRRNF